MLLIICDQRAWDDAQPVMTSGTGRVNLSGIHIQTSARMAYIYFTRGTYIGQLVHIYGVKAPKDTRTDRKTTTQGAHSTKVHMKGTHINTRQAS